MENMIVHGYALIGLKLWGKAGGQATCKKCVKEMQGHVSRIKKDDLNK